MLFTMLPISRQNCPSLPGAPFHPPTGNHIQPVELPLDPGTKGGNLAIPEIFHGTASNTISARGIANNFHCPRHSSRMYKPTIPVSNFTSALVL